MGYKETKYRKCPVDEAEAILLVDVETEMIPRTDKNGNKQYYCLEGQHTFSVDEDGTAAQNERPKKR